MPTGSAACRAANGKHQKQRRTPCGSTWQCSTTPRLVQQLRLCRSSSRTLTQPRVGQAQTAVSLSSPTAPTTCFFFQAEDGIRGADVTGVQTCALPIYDAFGTASTKTCAGQPGEIHVAA